MGYLENLWNALDFGSLRDMVLRLVSVFLCLTVHETCHGLAALALGDPTAKRARRLSLNPLRHIDWFGLLMMITVGFGWAKPVPVDPRYFRRPKQGMALTALAGPVSNFLLALVLLFAGRLVYDYAPYFRRQPAAADLPADHGDPVAGSGAVQPDPHPAAGRQQGAVLSAARPGV